MHIVDCEGCEWAALVGGRRTLRRVPMIKIELVQSSYADGNSSATPEEIVKFLHSNGYEIFKDHWLENSLYFGNRGNEVLDIDRMFGSSKFKLTPQVIFVVFFYFVTITNL